MSDFKQFLQYRALDLKFSLQGVDAADSLIESGAEFPIPLRNVCAKLTVELAERIDRTAANLGVTKRQFIERALIDAMDQADAMLTEVGVWDEFDAKEAK